MKQDLSNTYEWLVWTINWRDEFNKTIHYYEQEAQDIGEPLLFEAALCSLEMQRDDLNEQISEYGKR
jgi:hypothetical protein